MNNTVNACAIVEGLYHKTIFENTNSGYCIYVYGTEDKSVPEQARDKMSNDKKILFTATGTNLPKPSSAKVILSGNWESTSYGVQLHVQNYEELLPTSSNEIEKYLASGLIKGIGPKIAQLIVSSFGENSLKIIDENPERLLEIRGITEEKLEDIQSSYHEKKHLQKLVSFLAAFDISAAKAAQIYQVFGSRSMDIVMNNPFKLCRISGFGFKIVDSIAIKVKCRFDDPLRILGAMDYVLDEAAIEGHLYLEKDFFINKTYALLNTFKEYVSKNLINETLYSQENDGYIVNDNGRIYKISAFYSEVNTAHFIGKILRREPKTLELDEKIKNKQVALKIELSETQAEGVKCSLNNNIHVITGGPGTGKTTALKFIIELYSEIYPHKSFRLMAPTGRAARRMAESTGCDEASTLHSALGLRGEGNSSEVDTFQDDFFIIDESSMIDMWLAHELFKRIPNGAKLLFVGDADQLPSVGPGNFFRELINSELVPVTYLDTVYRQSDGSRIAINASRIRYNNARLAYDASDFRFLKCCNEEDAAKTVTEFYLQETKEKGLDSVQILSPFRTKGLTSVEALNENLHDIVNPIIPSLPKMKVGKRIFRIGDKVMQTKNKGDVSNGDIGYIQRILFDDEGKIYARISFGEERVFDYFSEDMNVIELGFATTIHKSQGSEYDTVIIPILKRHYIMLRRNLIYTAITRAKKKVILVGEPEALELAIHRNDTNKRNTALAKRIISFYNAQKIKKL